MVLDEAHTIKSSKSQCAQAAFALSAYCRWCLTGTPLQVFIVLLNYPFALYVILYWILLKKMFFLVSIDCL